MSLIEQATKRLEELKRAGVSVDDALQREGARLESGTVAAGFAHVPESALGQKAPARPAASNDRPIPPPLAKRPETPVVELDLSRLARNGILTPNEPRSQLAEEYRIIKRPLINNAQRSDGVRHANLIMVTSALPKEGKSFSSVNLAMSIAMELNNTVLLIDADVARPSMPGMLGIDPDGPGLLDLLTDNTLDVRDVLMRTNLERLSLIRAGTSHAKASELLASESMARLAAEISRRYADRIVIFDSPPLLATTESRVLAAHMGQIVMVVESEQTTHSSVKQALAAVEQCPIVLMLLNKSGGSPIGQYYGAYGQYGAETD
jgi:exopolysaccharide/PEP-CTERM locus tyrosine autokinase